MQLSKTLTLSVGGYLPNTLTQMWEILRRYGPSSPPGVRSIIGLSGCVLPPPLRALSLTVSLVFSAMSQIMIVTSEGHFYNIDLEHGGECTLMKQFR